MITEKQIDLFEEVKLEDCVILHCISADKAMGAGIAKPLQDTFKIRENWPQKLPKRLIGWNNKGYSVFVLGQDKVQVIGNLITKESYWNKPTYTTFWEALNDAAQTLNSLHLEGFNVPNKIVMPRVGCGLDKLEWEKVKPMIETVFGSYNVVVCYLYNR